MNYMEEDTGVFADHIYGTDRITGSSEEVNYNNLIELANTKMPFGKYAGRYLVELPETYILWFKDKGWPEGRIGEQLREIEEIKVNGLESLLIPLIRR